jgi:acetyltransferase-like isoleucine patch superfamily enzyme
MNSYDISRFKSVGRRSVISDFARIYKPEEISIGDNVRIDDFCMLSGGAGITIGSHIHISCGVYMFGGAGIIIEDFVNVSTRCTIFSQSDDFYGHSMVGPQVPIKFKPDLNSGLVRLGRHVLLGAGVTVFPGVTVAEGCSVGAHSVVTQNTSPWGIYAGTPARRIGVRSFNIVSLEKQFLSEWEGKT